MRTTASLLLAALVAGPAVSADWPQWRGPNRDGISPETNLLDTWPEGGPKLLWKKSELTDIGAGYGSPAVVGDKLFIVGADSAKQTAKEFVTCLSVKDCSKVWQTPLSTSTGKFLDGWGGGPRSTPTVDGDMLYVLGVTGDLICMTADKGEVKWATNLVKDWKGGIPTWGYSESPLVDGDTLIVTPGSKGGMLALNKKTGEKVWQCTDFSDAAGYSSVIPTVVGDVRQYVQQTMAGGIGVRAKDGKLLWKVGGLARRTAVIPTPIVADGYVFYTAGYGAGCECFKLEPDGDGTKATQVYTKNPNLQNHHGGVIQFGDYVYGHSDRGGWTCLNFKKGGDPVWTNTGVGKGSVTAADGYLYCIGEKSGTLARVKISEKDYEEAGRLTIPTQSELRKSQPSGRMTGVWPHPVIADGKLFLRDYELFFVYDISKPKS